MRGFRVLRRSTNCATPWPRCSSAIHGTCASIIWLVQGRQASVGRPLSTVNPLLAPHAQDPDREQIVLASQADLDEALAILTPAGRPIDADLSVRLVVRIMDEDDDNGEAIDDDDDDDVDEDVDEDDSTGLGRRGRLEDALDIEALENARRAAGLADLAHKPLPPLPDQSPWPRTRRTCQRTADLGRARARSAD